MMIGSCGPTAGDGSTAEGGFGQLCYGDEKDVQVSKRNRETLHGRPKPIKGGRSDTMV